MLTGQLKSESLLEFGLAIYVMRLSLKTRLPNVAHILLEMYLFWCHLFLYRINYLVRYHKLINYMLILCFLISFKAPFNIKGNYKLVLKLF